MTPCRGRRCWRHTTALRWFERVRWRYTVRCPPGLYSFGPVTLRSGDLFGLFSRTVEQAAPARLYVYPKLLELPRWACRRATRSAISARSSRCSKTRCGPPACASIGPRTRSSACIGRRPPGRGSCRCASIEQTTEHTLMLFLNVESSAHIYEGIEERRGPSGPAMVAASLARYATARRWSVGLRSNAPPPTRATRCASRPAAAPAN